MNKILLLVFFLYCCYSSPAQKLPASSNPMVSKMDKDIDALVQKFLRQQKTVGLEIGILRDGRIFYYGYGETERGNGRVPDEHTIFEIGSITKTFTATLLAKAVVDGKMKLSDPVNKYLPDSIPALSFQGVAVTLQTLANHTSAIPSVPASMDRLPEIKGIWSGDPFKDFDDRDLFSFYAHYRLKRKPGSHYEYSNLAFGTLGVLLERVYGKSWEQLVTDGICRPLGLTDTRQTVPSGDLSRMAQGYAANGQPAPAWHAKAFAGCGVLRSTVSDLLRYAQAEMGQAPDSLLAPIALTHQVTYRKKDEGVGLAWNRVLPDKVEWFYHGGATGGFGCFLWFSAEKKTAMVILTNKPYGAEDLALVLYPIVEKSK